MTASMYHSLLRPPKLSGQTLRIINTIATCAEIMGNCHGSSHGAEEWIADKDNKSLPVL